ncbi:MAG: phage holin family protein [Pseudomonadota bacterium]|nr:phage holin family protein [Pseudomonadota bacterium]
MNYNPGTNQNNGREAEIRVTQQTYGGGNGHSTADAPVGVLLRELAHEVPSLVTKEIALAKSEMRESLRATKAGIAAVATGGAVAVSGLIVLMFAAVYALSEIIVPWAAALIVGAVALLIGFGMVQAGKKKFEADALRPERTMNSLDKDKNAIRGRTQ